jgi:flagellar biogenesis protein FliO
MKSNPPPDNSRQPAPEEEEASGGVNIAAILLILALVIGGAWVFIKLGQHNDIENCIASGRHDCIDVRDFK